MNTTSLVEWEPGLYLDAFVTNSQHHVRFLSLWGRDGLIQHFLASLTLPRNEGGLSAKTISLPDERSVLLDFGHAKHLKKTTARLDKYSDVGEWVHLWLFDEHLNHYQGQSMTLLSQTPLDWEVLWPTVKQVCHLPLLESWKTPLESLLMPFITTLPSYGLYGTELSMPIEDIEPLISDAIQTKQLILTEQGVER